MQGSQATLLIFVLDMRQQADLSTAYAPPLAVSRDGIELKLIETLKFKIEIQSTSFNNQTSMFHAPSKETWVVQSDTENSEKAGATQEIEHHELLRFFSSLSLSLCFSSLYPYLIPLALRGR